MWSRANYISKIVWFPGVTLYQSNLQSHLCTLIHSLHNGLWPWVCRKGQMLKLLSGQSSSGWEIRMSSTHKVPYYFNGDTNASTWDAPLPKDELRKLPGAHYLEQPLQIRASHLLIKHRESRRPSSWKEVREIREISHLSFRVHRLHLNSRRLLGPRTKRSPSCGSTKLRSTTPQTSQTRLASWQRCIRIVRRTTRAAISGCLLAARCKSHLRKQRLHSKWERSAIL